MPGKATLCKSIKLRHNQYEFSLFQKAAKDAGKSDYRRFLRSELYNFYYANPDLPDKICPDLKYTNFFIPDDLVDYYNRLARAYNATVTKVIHRLVVFPHIVKLDPENTGAPVFFSGGTNTSIPEFSENEKKFTYKVVK